MKPIQACRTAPYSVTALLMGFWAGSAEAQSFTLNGFVSQYFDATSNAELQPVSPGNTYTATTSAGLSFIRQTETKSFSFDASTSLFLAKNPDGTSDQEFGYPSLFLNYTDRNRGNTFSFDAYYLVDPAGTGNEFGFVDLDDSGGFSPGDTTYLFSDIKQTTYGFALGYSAGLSDIDTIGITLRTENITFDQTEPDLIPSSQVNLTGDWSRQFTSDVAGVLTLGQEWFGNDDTVPTTSVTTTITAGANYQSQRGTLVGGDLGLQLARVTEGGVTTDTTSPTGSLFLNYDLPDGTLDFTADFGLEPTDGGTLQQTAGLGLDYERTINAVSSLSLVIDLNATADIGEPLGTTQREIIIAPAYNYFLSDSLAAQVGYQYQHVTGDFDGTSQSVFLGLTKNFSLLK